MGVRDTLGEGFIWALGSLLQVSGHPGSVWLGLCQQSVSCLPLGKSFALKDFRVILKKKRDFSLMIFQKSVPIYMP